MVEEGEKRDEFFSTVNKIRVKSLRKLLVLYYASYVEPISEHQLRRNSKRKPRVRPGINRVREFLGCNKASAMDYLYALDALENLILKRRLEYLNRTRDNYNEPEELWDRKLREPDEKNFFELI